MALKQRRDIAVRKLLIVYGTTEGQTRKIAEYLAQESRNLNYECELQDAKAVPEDIALSQFSKVIIAASVHMERHQSAVYDFVEEHLSELETIPTAFFSISLSAAGDDEERSDAWEYTRRFSAEINWRPTQVYIVAGALRFSEQDFFKRWAMRRLAKEKRADRKHDEEYTDWAELWHCLKIFLGPAI
jgi:menaquinone-dependent protoporphyrinogen oxidase